MNYDIETKELGKVLVDTSAWIEFFKKKDPYYSAVLELIDKDSVYCTGIVLAELLQGAIVKKELNTIKEFLHVFGFFPESKQLWEKTGELSYSLRRKGKIVGLSDCYIAVITSSNDARLLTLDKDFAVIKEIFGLNLHEP